MVFLEAADQFLTALDLLGKEEPLSRRERNQLAECANFLRVIDWNNPGNLSKETQRKYALRASIVRPVFCDVLLFIKHDFSEQGYSSDQQIFDFLGRFYDEISDDKANQSPNDKNLGILFLQQLSRALSNAMVADSHKMRMRRSF